MAFLNGPVVSVLGRFLAMSFARNLPGGKTLVRPKHISIFLPIQMLMFPTCTKVLLCPRRYEGNIFEIVTTFPKRSECFQYSMGHMYS